MHVGGQIFRVAERSDGRLMRLIKLTGIYVDRYGDEICIVDANFHDFDAYVRCFIRVYDTRVLKNKSHCIVGNATRVH